MSHSEKRVAVVTGASTGLGFGVATRLVDAGWTVIGISRSGDKLAKAHESLGELFEPCAIDVADYGQLSSVTALAAGRRIDLLVNNAARFRMAPYMDCTVADIDAIVDTNLKGTMYCTHRVLPLMTRPGGRIINIGSVAGTHGIAGQAIYCASKYGVDGFAEALGQELGADGIAVTTIYPGGIDTPLWNEDNPYLGDRSMLLQPADVADMVAYIANLPVRIVCKKVVVFPSNEWH